MKTFKLDRLLKLLPLFFMVIWPVLSQAETIYVANSGNDDNPGTVDKPVLTLVKAQQLARQNAGKDTVKIVLEDGTYYLSDPLVFGNEDSGTKNYPVIWVAANEGKAVISGGKLLRLNWEPYQDGIYRAKVDGNLNIDQLYINGQRQRMARFPNAEAGKNVFDSWELVHTHEPDLEKDPLDSLRTASWANPAGAFIHAMHKALWGDMHWQITGRSKDGEILLTGGWQNNRPTPMHPRYRMVEHVFEELDVPGEWFFSKEDGFLYYFPFPETELSSAKVEIVVLKHLIEFQGTKEKPVQFVQMNGLVFKHTARTFMENKEPLLRSDWTVYRGGTIFFNGAEDCVIADCEFDQVGGNTIFVNNYNRRLTFRSCYIHNSGANGIAFVGDPAMVRSPLFRYGPQDFENIDRTPGPIGDNYPADCLVEDCLITMTGRDEKQTAPVQISMSHNITVRHTTIYDVPRAGINISEGTFGGHVIEYCDVFNTVLETGDHGSFNSWGRDRFWTPDIRQTAVEIEKDPELYKLDMLDPNIIRNSRWRCDHGWDIDLDDGSSWYAIYNNVLLSGGLKLREGYNRLATNNIIINNSLHPHVWYPRSGDVFKHNIVFGAYRPAVMQRALAPDDKWGKELDNNLFVSSREAMEKFLVNGCDSNSLVGDPLFLNPAEGDYRVHEDSPALQVGFQNFPMDQFGVVSEKLRKIAKTPQIPSFIKSAESAIGEIYNWLGGEVKNIETWEEQSASGLSSMRGVIILSAPNGSFLDQKGFIKGDVILRVNNIDIISFEQLSAIGKNSSQLFEISVIRNQQERKFLIEFE
jgi:hypothetical protein